jgi:adenylate cyclase
MAREIERKYLLNNDKWRDLVYKSTEFSQGYLTPLDGQTKSSVRIRIEGEHANINIKSLEIGLSRDEYEYPIDPSEAKKMLASLCVGPVIEKVRHLVKANDYVWEIDEFLGDNQGLLVAEVEMESESEQPTLPDWAGKEVTEEPRYYNISLSEKPFSDWSEDEKNP